MNHLPSQSKPVLLVSCYELGRQPAGISMPAAFLEREGYRVQAMDVSVEGFDRTLIQSAWFVGISVPMHTALRLGLRVAEEIRRINPACHISFYGLYASLNSDYLLETVADSVIGGEFEQGLVELVKAAWQGKPIEVAGVATKSRRARPVLERLQFAPPERKVLPPLERYARLEIGGEERLAGYVEASRGCLHKCTHCPIPPVYDGRFFVIGKEVVLEDIRQLVASGARHITFGDPDFLNGPGHSMRIVRVMHDEFPELTFDFTSKVEHLLKHRDLMPELAGLGCVFVVSAVESLSESVLYHLKKGHTRNDVFEAFRITADAGVALRPSFVSFTPWTTIDDYIDVLEFVESQGLIDHVDPVQYSIRLLIPPGSLVLEDPDAARWLGPREQESFTYHWSHPDPRMDELQRSVAKAVEDAVQRNEDPAQTFYRVREFAHSARGESPPVRLGAAPWPSRLRPPRLTEAWFC